MHWRIIGHIILLDLFIINEILNANLHVKQLQCVLKCLGDNRFTLVKQKKESYDNNVKPYKSRITQEPVLEHGWFVLFTRFSKTDCYQCRSLEIGATVNTCFTENKI